jgi:hypothetical protein
MVKSKVITMAGKKITGDGAAGDGNNVTREGEDVFNFDSPAWNRSKFFVFYSIVELNKKDIAVTFNTLLIHSGVCYRTLICRLPVWVKWRYLLYGSIENGERTYILAQKGHDRLRSLKKYHPDLVSAWLIEYALWKRVRPLISPGSLSRPELIKVLEPLRYHREATHPGVSIYTAGGCWWVVARGGQRVMCLCPAPSFGVYFIKPLAKRAKLSAAWQFYDKIDAITSYIAAKAPLIHPRAIEQMVRSSIKGS